MAGQGQCERSSAYRLRITEDLPIELYRLSFHIVTFTILQPWLNVQAALYVLQSSPCQCVRSTENRTLPCDFVESGLWTWRRNATIRKRHSVQRHQRNLRLNHGTHGGESTVSYFHQGPVSRSIFGFPWIRRLCSSFCITSTMDQQHHLDSALLLG